MTAHWKLMDLLSPIAFPTQLVNPSAPKLPSPRSSKTPLSPQQLFWTWLENSDFKREPTWKSTRKSLDYHHPRISNLKRIAARIDLETSSHCNFAACLFASKRLFATIVPISANTVALLSGDLNTRTDNTLFLAHACQWLQQKLNQPCDPV